MLLDGRHTKSTVTLYTDSLSIGRTGLRRVFLHDQQTSTAPTSARGEQLLAVQTLDRTTSRWKNGGWPGGHAGGENIMSNFERLIPVLQREYGARDLEGHRWWFVTPAAIQRQG